VWCELRWSEHHGAIDRVQAMKARHRIFENFGHRDNDSIPALEVRWDRVQIVCRRHPPTGAIVQKRVVPQVIAETRHEDVEDEVPPKLWPIRRRTRWLAATQAARSLHMV
jgi:hypothetical protein